jgi:hypothetical protein
MEEFTTAPLYMLFDSYYLQHFVDTFRQGVIDVLLGNLEDISEISFDDPLEQITQIAQTALLPESRAPTYYFNCGAMGSDLKFAQDSVIFARLMTLFPYLILTRHFIFPFVAVTIWLVLKIPIGRRPSISW